jgi:hypothetical protein
MSHTLGSIDWKLSSLKSILNCGPIKGGFFHKVELLEFHLESIGCEIELSYKSLSIHLTLQIKKMIVASISGTSLSQRRKQPNKQGKGLNCQ